MLRKIDLILPMRSQFGVLHHFTTKIYEALLRIGYECRLIKADDAFTLCCQDPPDLTIAYNGVPEKLPGIYLCDLIERPHLCCLVDLAYRYFHLLDSPYMIMGCNDSFSLELLQCGKFLNHLFFPPAVDNELFISEIDQPRPYEVTLFTTFIDCEKRHKEWKDKFPLYVLKAMEEAVEITFSDNRTSFVEAFYTALNVLYKKGEIPSQAQLPFSQIFEQLELYVRGKQRIDLVEAIREAHIHIFDATIDERSWESYLGKRSNITYHPSVSYQEHLQIMKQSKIIISSSPHLKKGGPERVLNSLACGALPITNEGVYLQELFKDQQDLLFYPQNDLSGVSDQIDFYLKNEDKRLAIVKSGKKKVKENHTWDRRVAQLLPDLQPLLDHINSLKH